MSRRLTIALRLRNPKEADEADETLRSFYRVIRLGAGTTSFPTNLDADLLAAEVDPTDAAALSALASFRDLHPEIPVLLMARDLDVDLGVELVKLLGDDLLSLPVRRERELRLKIERLLLGRQGPALERSLLTSALPGRSTTGSERRRAHRAAVPAGWQALARIEGASRPVLARVVDLTIELPDWPGAMRMALGRQTAEAMLAGKLVPEWGRGVRHPFVLTLEHAPRELPIEAQIVRVPRPTAANEFPFVVQYKAKRAKDSEELVLFWTRCQAASVREQRRERRAVA